MSVPEPHERAEDPFGFTMRLIGFGGSLAVILSVAGYYWQCTRQLSLEGQYERIELGMSLLKVKSIIKQATTINLEETDLREIARKSGAVKIESWTFMREGGFITVGLDEQSLIVYKRLIRPNLQTTEEY